MKTKPTSCGILFKYNNKYLICRSTNCGFVWGIPKGLKEDNEEPVTAAIRESFEETNIKVNENQVTHLLSYSNKRKSFEVYLCELNEFIPVEDLKCFSYLDNNQTPEIDSYKWVTVDEAFKFVRNHMSTIFNHIKEELN